MFFEINDNHSLFLNVNPYDVNSSRPRLHSLRVCPSLTTEAPACFIRRDLLPMRQMYALPPL